MASTRNGRGTEQLGLYQEIMEKIMTGEYSPGQRLVEEQLAKLFRVSRTPVREVLFALERDGLIERGRYTGARVVGLTAADIEDLYDIRKALEVSCVERVIQTAKLSEMLEFEHNLTRLNSTEGTGQQWCEEQARLDLMLHRWIITMSGNRRLIEYMQKLSMLIRSLQLIGFRDESEVRKAGEHHLKIVRAFLDSDVQLGQRLVSEHVELAKRNTIGLLVRLKSEYPAREAKGVVAAGDTQKGMSASDVEADRG
jgi:GntR family transcriptional regulator, rspAB operon transcriptional repressor